MFKIVQVQLFFMGLGK